MTAFTTNQWAILGLVLVLGWLLGLMSRSGGGKWRRAYETERSDHIASRHAYDARITELERRTPAGIGSGVGTSVGAAAAGRRDDLALIHGIGRGGETRLNEAGIHNYGDLTRLSDSDAAALERRLGLAEGIIVQERWREQAEMLAAGRHDEHRRMFA
ncbi:MAG TPA: hypothetical protein VF649_13680 [Sphingomonas sp.]|jgi:predicted flap endonuclease-1-like 5' DNA nuclease|uniref:hypothetical protein n=1 Tax=Sphingomonas sp. TaxID=28214 RepID=UPI002ED8E023